MHNSRPIAIPVWLFDVPILPKTFDRAKLDEDLEVGVRDLYQSDGYFKVVVKDPILKTVDVNRGGLAGAASHDRPRARQSHQHHHPHRRGRAVPHGTAGDPQRRSGQGPFPQARIPGNDFPAEEGRYLRRRQDPQGHRKLHQDSTASTATSISRPRRFPTSTTTPRPSI